MFSSQVPGPLGRLHWVSVTSRFVAIKFENQKEPDKNKLEENGGICLPTDVSKVG